MTFMLRGPVVGKLGAGCALLLVLGTSLAVSGCAGKPERFAKVTRFQDKQRVSRTQLPICPLGESDSLAKRHRLDTCMRAIKNQGIAVAQDDRQPCLTATIGFASRHEGNEGECTTSYPRAPYVVAKSDCSSRPVYQYSLKLVLSDPEDAATVLESYVVTEGAEGGLDATISTLCRGAIYKYPKTMRGALITLDEK
jgi:hypothetical protein